MWLELDTEARLLWEGHLGAMSTVAQATHARLGGSRGGSWTSS